jgi:hypothetical protein
MVKGQSKRWWLPVDFQTDGLGDLFVGYEATARFAELAKKYPQMIDSRRKGKYVERRIKFESGKTWYATLPPDLKAIFKKYYVKPAEEQQPEPDEIVQTPEVQELLDWIDKPLPKKKYSYINGGYKREY